VTAVRTGTATIFAEAKGIRGTKLVRTLPNFDGEWSVDYRINRCEASGDFSCEYPPMGAYLKLVQSRDAMSGGFIMTDWYSYGFESNDLVGLVGPDGILSFAASAPHGIDGSTNRWENGRFELRPDAKLTGSFEQVWSGGGNRGSVRYFCEVTTSSRVRGG
jgi:hypothetical protein